MFALATFLAFTSKVQAQMPGTEGDGFQVQVIIDGVITNYLQTNCGYGVSRYGPDVTQEMSAEIVWADGDSLGCTVPTNDLTGKFALIRRGICNFSLKSYNAQTKGAIGTVIANHFNTATENGCSLIIMTGGDSAAKVTTPAIFACRDMATDIATALDAGKKVTMKWVFPRMYDATAAYHYATPVQHVDTLDHITVNYANRSSAAQTDVVLKCDIIAPGGGVSSLQLPIPSVAAGLDSAYNFPSFMPSKVKGEFKAVFSNNKFVESRDTLVRTFEHTDYTWSQANFVNDPGGVGSTNADFLAGDFIYQCGGLVLTGDNAANKKATHISFGISNIDSVYIAGGNSGENDILVFVYDGDPDDNGTIDFADTWDAMNDNFQQVAFGTYTMNGTEKDGILVHPTIADVSGNNFLELEANHPYYVSLLYSGLAANTSRCIRFMNSTEEHYLNFPTTPVYIAKTMYSGWAGSVVMHQLQLDGFVPPVSAKNPVLADNKVAIAPNPATDEVRVDLKLDAVSPGVAVRMIDVNGRIYDYQKMENFQNGQVTFDTQSMPSGIYFVWISTAEGSTVKRVAVCH